MILPSVVARYIDRTPMYMVVLYSLFGLTLWSFILSVTGYLAYSTVELAVSFCTIMIISVSIGMILAAILKVTAQHLSSVITALILFLILLPGATGRDVILFAMVSVIAVASKYILVYRKQHLVNPAAIGAVVIGFLGLGGAGWWVASPLFFIPLLIGGALVVIKMRRETMVLTFLCVAFLVYLLDMWRLGLAIPDIWLTFWVSYPAIFLACFMLTEPFTMPGTRRLQIIYAVVVAVLANTALSSTIIPMTPELALVIGNIALYPWSARQKLFLTLREKAEIAPATYLFTFDKPKGATFLAGQYMEWMLPHQQSDNRGIRRYFTIASAPSTDTISVAMKVPEKASTYKRALSALSVGDTVIASQIAGDFLLPYNSKQKLAWVAGGIGVTPFMSKATTLVDREDMRDIVMLYATQTKDDIVRHSALMQVATIIPVVGTGEVPVNGESGYVTVDMIKRRVPDYMERLWFVSGPSPMVQGVKKSLRSLGVPRRQIIEDFFPGLA